MITKPSAEEMAELIGLRSISPNSCWVNCARSHVYVNGAKTKLRQASYIIFKGGRAGVRLVNLCGNKACFNPMHFSERLRGEEIVSHKLVEEDIPSIRDDIRSLDAIARQYGVSASTIGVIKRRKVWKHVPDRDPGELGEG